MLQLLNVQEETGQGGRMFTGHEFLGACMCLEFQSISTMSVLNSMFIGDLFLIEVSDIDGLLLSLVVVRE